ncbi:gag/pol protein [Cucumis melo var. makuwa]|uniref:Gag/pol protein n=1 Tax=Cucumis melo var. makuwa TaxID=1194695 RepID=A0A5A7UI25_CUCMM|nr:gag/pol protein [Cucumis melo var. makuwa]TYK08623.1 gag/pol protein [Cucumis melo var. makuwa]
MPRRSGRIVSQPNHYLDSTETQVIIPDDGVEDSLSYKKAMNDVNKDQWVKAMDLEIESIPIPNMNFSTTLYYDNNGAVANSKEPCSHVHIKEVSPNTKDCARGDVIVTKFTSKHNIADMFMKTLMAKVFKDHLESLGLRDMYIR